MNKSSVTQTVRQAEFELEFQVQPQVFSTAELYMYISTVCISNSYTSSFHRIRVYITRFELTSEEIFLPYIVLYTI
jgi:hypothetical protein